MALSAPLTARNRYAGLCRTLPADHPAIEDARAELAAANLAAYIRKVVDAAPPLSETHRAELAALLRGGATS